MVARSHGFTIEGPQARHVVVEVDVRAGLPGFAIVGLPEAAAREARERVQTAIRNSGFQWPAKRITVNLTPGASRRGSPGLDLALASAILAAAGEQPAERLSRVALFGELRLDGTLRGPPGALAAANAALEVGLRTFATAPEAAREAAILRGLAAAPLADLLQACKLLGGGAATRAKPLTRRAAVSNRLDLADVHGRAQAVEALTIAAAGGHSLLLSGPPGVGKTMLARRLPGILPPPDPEEAVELALLKSLLGEERIALPSLRPFREPSQTITPAGLLGGAGERWAGEVVLAHTGVLFLDELPDFSKAALDGLRQPLEDGSVTRSSGSCTVTRPARTILICAMNPCPCGYADQPERCTCRPADLARARRRLSGSLLDRIDMFVAVPVERDGTAPVSSSGTRKRVADARARQASRLRREGRRLNSEMDAAQIARHIRLDRSGAELIADATANGLLSSRGEQRTLALARTIADLAGSERVDLDAVESAIALRGEPCRPGAHAAFLTPLPRGP